MKFQVGVKAFQKVMKKKRFNNISDCRSCIYNYEDKYGETGCHNSNVTQFDIVEDGDRTYCHFWSCVKERAE